MLNYWIGHIEFAYPWVLTALLIIPILILWHFKYNIKSNAALSATTVHFLYNVKSIRTKFYPVLFILRCLGILSLIIAIARPEFKFQKDFIEGDGINIMLCLDVSGSMKTEDIKPTRLKASIEIAKNFVRSRIGDQIGIVVFSSHSLTLCPLTIDTNAIINQINSIKNPSFSEAGTVIGSGIAACINRLKYTKVKTKIIILLTDGVNSEDAISPIVASRLAKDFGIKIYAIGIGRSYENIEDDQKLNETLLKNIAIETNGKYFNASNMETLKKAFQKLNNLEKSKIKTVTYAQTIDKFVPFLFFSFSFIFIEISLRYTVFRKFP